MADAKLRPGFRTLGAWYGVIEDILKTDAELADLKARADDGNPDAAYLLARTLAKQDVALGSPPDFARGLPYLVKSATAGHVRAQHHLSLLYFVGFAVSKDDAKGLHWLLASARSGYDVAQLDLGLKYRAGQQVPKSASEATYWLMAAARQGNPVAQFWVGYDGAGSPDEAKRWMLLAAEGWYTRAMCVLADWADEDGGADADVEVYKWLWLATRKRDPEAWTNLGRVEARISKEQLVRAQAAAEAWLQMHPIQE